MQPRSLQRSRSEIQYTLNFSTNLSFLWLRFEVAQKFFLEATCCLWDLQVPRNSLACALVSWHVSQILRIRITRNLWRRAYFNSRFPIQKCYSLILAAFVFFDAWLIATITAPRHTIVISLHLQVSSIAILYAVPWTLASHYCVVLYFLMLSFPFFADANTRDFISYSNNKHRVAHYSRTAPRTKQDNKFLFMKSTSQLSLITWICFQVVISLS